MGPKHAHGNSVDPDQTPLRGLRRKKSYVRLYKKIFYYKTTAFLVKNSFTLKKKKDCAVRVSKSQMSP